MADATVGILRVLLTANSAEFDSAMKRAQQSAKDWSKDLQSIGQQATQLGSALTRTLTVPLLGFGAGAAKMAIDFESSFAGVRKTVNATEPEFAALAQGLRDMAKEIPVNVNELNRVAEAAGQLGVKKDDILQFTRTMADLGVTTNLTADEAATATAQLQNIFGAAGKDVDRFGATLVALGNAGASTEKDIIDMGLRIAGAGHTIGLTQAQVLSFASALSSVGINAEAGGSAISRTFLKINDAVAGGGKALDEFARVAGMTAAQFKASFEKDAAGATVTFIEGLKRLKDSGENVNATLEGLVGKNIIIKDTLLRASGAGQLLREQLELGNKAWQDNAALVNEARERYKTTESQLTVLWNRVKDVGITLGNALLPTINLTIQALGNLIPVVDALAKGFAAMPVWLQASAVAFGVAVAAIGPLLFVMGQLITAASAVSGAFAAKGIATRALAVLLPSLTTATSAQAAANVAVGTTATTAAVGVNALKLAALGLGQAFGAILVVGGSVVLVARAIAEATKLSSESSERASMAANEQARRYAMMAEASRIAGTSIHSYDMAIAIVTENARKLADETRKGSAATAEWQGPLQQATAAVAAHGSKLDQVRSIIKGFSDEQRKLIRENHEAGDSNKEIATALHLTGVSADFAESAVKVYLDSLKGAGKEASKAAKEITALNDALSGKDAFSAAAQWMASVTAIGGIWKLTREEQERGLGVLQQAIDKYNALHQAAPPAVIATAIELDAMNTRLRDGTSFVEALGLQFQTTFDGVRPTIDATIRELERLGKIHPGFENANTRFTPLIPGAFPEKDGVALGDQGGQAIGKGIIGALGDVLKTQLGPTIMAAITGGGNIGQAIGGLIGQSLSGSLAKTLTTAFPQFMSGAFGQLLGSFLPGIGALMGPLLGKVSDWFKGLFGVSKEVRQARSALEQFQSTLRGTLTDTQKAEAGTEGWRQDVVRVRDAYLATGRTAAQAEAIVRQLWDTDHPEAAKRAMEEINRVLEEEKRLADEAAKAIEAQEQAFDDAKQEAGELIGTIDDLAQRADGLPGSVQPYIDKLLELGLITEEQATHLHGLRREGEVDWEAMKAAAERYGVDLDSLGGRFQSARIRRGAQEIINDFGLLTRGGADVGGVLSGMADEISALVQDSVKFGTVIPGNMRPWIQELTRAGLLLDAQGNKIENLDNLNFGEDLKDEALIAREGFAGIIAKLDELIAKITGPLAGALDEITRDRTIGIDVDYRFTDPPVPRFDDPDRNVPTVGVSRGGLILGPGRVQYFADGGFVPKGTDTVPAMLTPGEIVLPAGSRTQPNRNPVRVNVVQSDDLLLAIKSQSDGFVNAIASFVSDSKAKLRSDSVSVTSVDQFAIGVHAKLATLVSEPIAAVVTAVKHLTPELHGKLNPVSVLGVAQVDLGPHGKLNPASASGVTQISPGPHGKLNPATDTTVNEIDVGPHKKLFSSAIEGITTALGDWMPPFMPEKPVLSMQGMPDFPAFRQPRVLDEIISRENPRDGNRDSGGPRNTTLVAVPVFIDNPHDIDAIADRVNRRVKETFAEDVALDQYGLSSQLVPLLAARIDDRRRR